MSYVHFLFYAPPQKWWFFYTIGNITACTEIGWTPFKWTSTLLYTERVKLRRKSRDFFPFLVEQVFHDTTLSPPEWRIEWITATLCNILESILKVGCNFSGKSIMLGRNTNSLLKQPPLLLLSGTGLLWLLSKVLREKQLNISGNSGLFKTRKICAARLGPIFEQIQKSSAGGGERKCENMTLAALRPKKALLTNTESSFTPFIQPIKLLLSVCSRNTLCRTLHLTATRPTPSASSP